MELLKYIKYHVGVALINIKLWLLLRAIHIVALISKKPEQMQQYNMLNYKFTHQSR
jgi:hypothetical protein